MKVEKHFDGWTLLPENRKDRQMIRELWNYLHPRSKIKRLGKNPKIVLRCALRRHLFKGMIRTISVYLYKGEERNDRKS